MEDPNKVVLKIRGYETLNGLSEPALACVVKRVGPVIIGFDASGAGLQHYKCVSTPNTTPAPITSLPNVSV